MRRIAKDLCYNIIRKYVRQLFLMGDVLFENSLILKYEQNHTLKMLKVETINGAKQNRLAKMEKLR